MSFVVAVVVTAGAFAQEQGSGLSARQLFFKPSIEATAPPAVTPQAAPKPAPQVTHKAPARPSTVPVPSILGLRYSIVQPSSSGTMDEVDEQKTFRSGEQFALMLESNEAAYLYVIAQSEGNWDVLFPDAGEANRIKGRTRVQIPPQCKTGGECFKFDEEPGAEHMFVVLSQSPEADLDRMIRAVVGKSRRSKDGQRLPPHRRNYPVRKWMPCGTVCNWNRAVLYASE